MKALHVKKLEKYHPGYKDRELKWFKLYFTVLHGDYEFELLDEIDKWRYIAFIVLELKYKHPVPLDPKYLSTKGFNFKKRSMSITVNMLQNFTEVVELPLQTCNVYKKEVYTKEVYKQDKYKEDKSKNIVTEFLNYFNLKNNAKLKLTDDRKVLIKKKLEEGYTLEQLKICVDNFIQDDWEERSKYVDVIYCIGKQKDKPDNLEKWLNYKPNPLKGKVSDKTIKTIKNLSSWAKKKEGKNEG